MRWQFHKFSTAILNIRNPTHNRESPLPTNFTFPEIRNTFDLSEHLGRNRKTTHNMYNSIHILNKASLETTSSAPPTRIAQQQQQSVDSNSISNLLADAASAFLSEGGLSGEGTQGPTGAKASTAPAMPSEIENGNSIITVTPAVAPVPDQGSTANYGKSKWAKKKG